jgi:hypothetical protein
MKGAHETLACLLRMKNDQPTLSTRREGGKSSESHSWPNWTEGEYRLQFLENPLDGDQIDHSFFLIGAALFHSQLELPPTEFIR